MQKILPDKTDFKKYIDSLKTESPKSIRCNTIKISPEKLTDLIKKVDNGTISNLSGKDVLKVMLDSGKNADEIIEEKQLAQVSDDDILDKIALEVITENEKVVKQIKEGNENAIGFLIGQAMKKSKGKANPKLIGEIIKRRLTDG